jgi:Family of unknown function (DUF6011)
MKSSFYRWVWVDRPGGEGYRNVGINCDGTLINPCAYPADSVRAAVEKADAYWRERRSASARKAAVTRRARVAKRIYAVAGDLTFQGKPVGPRNRCFVCGRKLTDLQSIARGIGSECWEDVLTEIEKEKAKAHRHDVAKFARHLAVLAGDNASEASATYDRVMCDNEAFAQYREGFDELSHDAKKRALQNPEIPDLEVGQSRRATFPASE